MIGILEKSTGYGTNVPFRIIGWLRACQDGDSAQSIDLICRIP